MFKDLKDFLDYLIHEKRYSKHTITSYSTDISQLIQFAELQYEIKEIDRIKHQIIRSWIVELMQSGQKEKSINRKISSVRSFFNYLRKNDVVNKNPMQKILAPKIPKRLPSVIREDHLHKLFDKNIENMDFYNQRDLMIVEMLYCTGMRRIELIGLEDVNVDLHQNKLKVLGKGNKERYIPLSDQLMTQIKNYIEARNEFFEKELFPALFVTNQGKRLYPKFVYNLVTRILAKVSTASKRSPHVLRHSFATHLTNNGADINAIKSLLGHANLGATQIYTHNSIEKLKEVYQKSHPKALKRD